MDALLQWLGGTFYFLNKVFLLLSEYALNRGSYKVARKWRVVSWIVYLAGLPPWVIILVYQRNWIAASVEASGAPAMLLGLITALRGTTKDTPRWLDRLAFVCIPLGFAYSLYDFGGLRTLNQWLEIGLVAGFLIGTYQLAKEHHSGYLWFVLMHISAGSLMWRQGLRGLFLQQLTSLIFIVNAYLIARRRGDNR